MARTPVTVLTEGSGGQENGEINGVQIARSNLCHNKEFQLYPAGTGEWRYWAKPSCSRASVGAGQQKVYFHTKINTGMERMNVCKAFCKNQ